MRLHPRCLPSLLIAAAVASCDSPPPEADEHGLNVEGVVVESDTAPGFEPPLPVDSVD